MGDIMSTASHSSLDIRPHRFRASGVRPSIRKPHSDRKADVRVLLNLPYAGNEEHRQKLDLYLPDRLSFPVVVFAHGGAWVQGNKAMHGHLGVFLAKHGIGAALVNYRLAPHVRHPGPAQDLARAFAWVHGHIAEHGGDTDRLFLCGHSAGGHLCSLLGTNEAFLATEKLSFEHVRGVISISGVYKIHWNMILAGLSFVFRKVNKTAASPFWHVKPGSPPFLILHAQKDLWTLAGQARAFHKRLLRHHCRSRLVVARGEDHDSIIQNAALPTAEHGKEVLRFIHEV
jgi:acetyl esterase/lipase